MRGWRRSKHLGDWERRKQGVRGKTLIYLCLKFFQASLKPAGQAEQPLPIRLIKMSQDGGTCTSPLVFKVDTVCPGKSVV